MAQGLLQDFQSKLHRVIAWNDIRRWTLVLYSSRSQQDFFVYTHAASINHSFAFFVRRCVQHLHTGSHLSPIYLQYVYSRLANRYINRPTTWVSLVARVSSIMQNVAVGRCVLQCCSSITKPVLARLTMVVCLFCCRNGTLVRDDLVTAISVRTELIFGQILSKVSVQT